MNRFLLWLAYLVGYRPENYRVDGWEEPLETEHFARDPQWPIEKQDAKFRRSHNGDPTL